MKVLEKFWSKVDKTSDCWEWLGSTNNMGYGYLCFNGKTQGAHRISWELTYGLIPDGFFVLHDCDNRLCVRPSHLWLGTQADNQADKARKNRSASGEAHGRSRLKAIEIIKIRELSAQGLTQASIAKLFGIVQPHVNRIVHLSQWGRI